MFKKYFFTLGLLLVSMNNSLGPFLSDGCTYFSNGTSREPELWLHCCFEHDLRYWFGGSLKERDKSDLRLKGCVSEVAGNHWANLIYTGVRLGHASPLKNKGHWGWGWSAPRANSELNDEEKTYVKKELQDIDLDPQFLKGFIDRNGL